MTTDIRLSGMKELSEKLKAFPEKMGRQVLRGALTSAMAIGRKAVQNATYTTVTRRTGLLKAGMGMRRLKKPIPMGALAVGVYALPGSKAFMGRAEKQGKVRYRKTKKGGRSVIKVPFYWRFLEFGSKRMSPRPYIGRAFSGVAQQMVSVYQRRIQEGIEKIARR